MAKPFFFGANLGEGDLHVVFAVAVEFLKFIHAHPAAIRPHPGKALARRPVRQRLVVALASAHEGWRRGGAVCPPWDGGA